MRLVRQTTEILRDLIAKRNALTSLANRYGSDKGTRNFFRHNYTRIYEPLFRSLRDKPIRLLEIGLLNNQEKRSWKRRKERYQGNAAGSRAPSLQMWSNYFPKAEIFGFDINDFGSVSLDRCKIVRGDMGSREDLAKLVSETGGRFDVVIEDASHSSHHQQIALGFLFPHVTAGGLYIVEDLHWQPHWLEIPNTPKTRGILQKAAVTGEFASPLILPEERVILERDAASIRLYDSMSPDDQLEFDDALCVIRKS